MLTSTLTGSINKCCKGRIAVRICSCVCIVLYGTQKTIVLYFCILWCCKFQLDGVAAVVCVY